MNKIAKLLLCVALLFSCIAPAHASDIVNSDIISDIPEYEKELLEALDISIDTTKTLTTRGEFAKILSLTAGKSANWSLNSESSFSDVAKGSFNYEYINSVCTLGLMNGVGDGLFKPLDYINTLDATVAFVRLAGYDIASVALGGYPNGYLKLASDIGILDNITSYTKDLTPQILSTLVYNTLHTDVYQISMIGDTTTYTAIEDKDILSVYHDVYYVEDVVTANKYTSLSRTNTPCRSDEIEIGKKIYKLKNESLSSYIGQRVGAYYKKLKSDSVGLVISINADSNDNDIIKINGDNLGSINGNNISYFVDGREKTANVIRGFNLIYNMRYYSLGNMSFIDSLKNNGIELTLIDNDKKGGYETVIVDHAQTMIVSSIDSKEHYIYGRGGSIKYDDSDTSSFISLKDTMGMDIYIDRIKSGDVLTYYKSMDSVYVRAILSYKTVTGTIAAIDSENETVILNTGKEEVEYKVVPEYMPDMLLGCSGDFYLDAIGRLVYTDSKGMSGYKYAYLINGNLKNGLERPELMLLTSCGFEIYKLADKFSLDGVRTAVSSSSSNSIISAGSFKPQVVRYKLSTSNEISYIDTVSTDSADEVNDSLKASKTASNVYYNEKSYNFDSKFMISASTLFIKAPDANGVNKYDTDYYQTGINLVADEKYYTQQIEAYDMDDGLIPSVVVIRDDSKEMSANFTNYTQAALVSQTNVKCIDKEGEAREGIRVFTKEGETKTLYFSSEYPVSRTMEFGDIIVYILDADDNIKDWKMDYDCSSNVPINTDTYTFLNSKDAWWYSYEGRPFVKNESSFSFLTLENTPGFDVNNPDFNKLYVFPATMMAYIEVDMKTETIALSSFEYLDSFKYSSDTSYKCYTRIYRGGGMRKDMFVTYKNIK